MNPPFTSRLRPLPGGGGHLALYGDLDYDTAVFARRAITAATARWSELVIDVAGLRHVDGFGLATLVKASQADGVRLANPSASVREASRAAGVHQVLAAEPIASE